MMDYCETHRILKDDGHFIVQLPEVELEEVMINHLYEKHGWEWARLIDRNKYATTYPRYHAKERLIGMNYWEGRFRVAKEVELRPDLVHVMWDIGQLLFPADGNV